MCLDSMSIINYSMFLFNLLVVGILFYAIRDLFRTYSILDTYRHQIKDKTKRSSIAHIESNIDDCLHKVELAIGIGLFISTGGLMLDLVGTSGLLPIIIQGLTTLVYVGGYTYYSLKRNNLMSLESENALTVSCELVGEPRILNKTTLKTFKDTDKGNNLEERRDVHEIFKHTDKG